MLNWTEMKGTRTKPRQTKPRQVKTSTGQNLDRDKISTGTKPRQGQNLDKQNLDKTKPRHVQLLNKNLGKPFFQLFSYPGTLE